MRPIDLPTFEASWWPLHMETVPGSGERITCGVLVRAASGQSSVRQVLTPSLVTTIFGASGKGLLGMIVATVTGLQKQLDAGVPVADLVPAFGGFELGEERDAVAHDLNEIFDIASRLTTAFSESPFGHRLEVSSSSREAFEDWADRVRDALQGGPVQERWQDQNFRVRVALGTKKKAYLSVVRGAYAANFGVLRPGHTSGDSRSLKVKVFDLEAFRRGQGLAQQHVELLVGCPDAANLQSFSRREVDGFHASLDFVQHEAAARGVPFKRFVEPKQAARYLEEHVA